MPNLKHCEIVTDVDKLKVDIQATIMKYNTIKYWAYIIHDKDDTRPHYHIYLNFGNNSVSTKDVAKWFEIEENFIEKVKGRKTDMYKYLTHSNDSQKFKHQYSFNEVKANFDIQAEIMKADIVGNFEKYSYAEQIKYVSTLPSDERATVFTKMEKLWKLHCKEMSLSSERNMKVIFVTGGSGLGKTYYAKKLFESYGYDYCISSSSNDTFQDYLGQRGMLLDDMRDTTFDFDDLLKILDNNTKSSVFSRFSNKSVDCKLMIISSSIPINHWYGINYNINHKEKSIAFEDRNQLFRRIGSYVIVKKYEIWVYNDGLDDKGNPIGEPIKYINEIPEKKCQENNSFKISDTFDKFLKRTDFGINKDGQVCLIPVDEDENLPF